MRILGRGLLIVAAALLCVGVVLLVSPVINRLFTDSFRGADLSGTSSSTVYLLDYEDWTRFPFSNPPSAVRILTQAEVPASAFGSTDAAWRYGMEYEVVDAALRPLAQGVLNLGAILPALRELQTGELRPIAQYAEIEGLPTAADATILDLSDIRHAAALRLRSAPSDPQVAGITVRVYEQRPIPERRLDTAWERLSRAERQRLMEGNIYPADVFTTEERRNAVRNAWYPIGPSGQEGAGYETRDLVTSDTAGAVRTDAERRQ